MKNPLTEISSLALECELVSRAITKGDKAILENEIALAGMRQKQIARQRELARQRAKLPTA